MQAKF